MKIVIKEFLLLTQEQTFAKYDFIQDIDNVLFHTFTITNRCINLVKFRMT